MDLIHYSSVSAPATLSNGTLIRGSLAAGQAFYFQMPVQQAYGGVTLMVKAPSHSTRHRCKLLRLAEIHNIVRLAAS